MKSRYTYIVDIKDLDKTWDNFEKRLKYSINKCPERLSTIIKPTDWWWEEFDGLHKQSRPDRKIDCQYIKETFNKWYPNVRLYFTKSACAMIGWDKKQGYYLLAGRNKTISNGSPARILWEAMRDLNAMGITKFEMCGANKPNIVLFKKSFGGKLVKQKKPCISY